MRRTSAHPVARRRVLSRPSLRAIGALSAIAVAYHQSLVFLVGEAIAGGPLAYLAVVPVTAIGLAWLVVATERPHPAIHDRQTDYIVGLSLLIVVVSVTFLSTQSLGAGFASARIDMLTLPITAAGVVSILFGVRRLWTVRWVLAYVLLAWPGLADPLAHVIGESSRTLSDAVLHASAFVLPVATRVLDGPDGMFSVDLGGRVAVIHAGSDWSAGRLSFGFMLVGAGVAATAKGRLMTRVAWLIGAVVGVWALGVVLLQVDLTTAALAGFETTMAMRQPLASSVFLGATVLIAAVAAIRMSGIEVGRDGPDRMDRWPYGPWKRAFIVVGAVAVALAWLNASTTAPTASPISSTVVAAGTVTLIVPGE